MKRALKNRLLGLTAVSATFGLMACDDLLHPPAQGPTTLLLSYANVFSARIATTTPDRVHVLVGFEDDTVYDNTLPFAAGAGEVRIRINIPLEHDSKDAFALIELLEGPRIVSRGGEYITLKRGETHTVSILADGLEDNISLTDGRTCALMSTGEAFCWGVSNLGYGGTGGSTRPVMVAGGHRFVSIDAGLGHTCALTESGQAWCWGNNTGGQLGDGTKVSSLLPVAVASNLRFKSITAGAQHSCALAPDGQAYCWGNNSFGQLGITGTEALLPTAVSGGRRFDQMRVGFFEACGLVSGVAYCWGRGAPGGGSPNTFTPSLEPGNLTFTFISPGNRNRCGVTSTGAGYCWSPDPVNFGQQGNGTTTPSATPVPVTGGLTFRVIVPTRSNASQLSNHVCGLTIDGTAYCWGNNRIGQLGASTGSSTCPTTQVSGFSAPVPCSLVPIAVTGGHRFAAISLGWESTCAIREDGEPFCWGYGYMGALGQGDLFDRSVPTAVGADITGPVAAGVRLQVSKLTLTLNEATAASANLIDQFGLAVPGAVQWSTSDSTRVSIAPDLGPGGLPAPLFRVLLARGRGTAIITATAAGFTTTANIVVN